MKRRRADGLTEEELDLAVAAGKPKLRTAFAAGSDGLREFHAYQEAWVASWQLSPSQCKAFGLEDTHRELPPRDDGRRDDAWTNAKHMHDRRLKEAQRRAAERQRQAHSVQQSLQPSRPSQPS